ncbi:MAG TPA: hypothetical protein VEW26_14750, partial [Allosphingosinicella sp.]|nr:hypothetical protein [Allosphingosinicella sp.]
VEIEERHEATRERLRKGEALEAAKDLRNTAEVEVDEERKQKKPKKGAKSPPTEKEAKLQELEAKVGVAGQEYAGAIQAEDKATAHDALLKEADASRTVAADALAAAQQASSGATGPAAALGTLVAAADSALGFYRDAAKFRATTAASKAHVADTRTKAEAAVAAAETQARSLDAQNPARATFGPVIAAQKAWLAALVRVTDNATTSERLRAFESFVRSNNIAPPTEYAGTGIYDFYAESYALYVLDPTFLKNNRPKLFDWFEVNR